jgi:Ca2+-transporting ATPase
MYMATFHVEGSGVRVYLKGAPERVLDLCGRVLTPTGEQPAGSAARAALHRQRETLAARGLRVLAVASGPVARPTEDAIRDLVFVGVFGLTDPPTPGVEETIRAIRAAGIRPVMLTGDHRSTAEAVARALGVLSGADETLDGRELAALPPATLAERVAQVGAFSRIGPEDKLKIVAAYQARGEVVAMLGDGVNDAPALRQADIGVAMGLRGSDVAREAADLVLQDDRLETVAAAIEEGRVIFDNIRKFVFYLFSCNLAEVLVFLGAAVAGWLLPPNRCKSSAQLGDGHVPALALALEPAEPDVMRRRRVPAHRDSIGLDPAGDGDVRGTDRRRRWRHSLGLVRWPDDPAQAITAAFVTLGLAQTFHLGNARSTGPVVTTRRALSNRHALAAVALALALLWLAVSWGPLARTLGTHPLTAPEWAVVVGLGSRRACSVRPSRARGLGGPRRGPVRPGEQDRRPSRSAQHLVAHAAAQQSSQPAAGVRGDDDEIRAARRGGANDGLRRSACHDARRDRHALLVNAIGHSTQVVFPAASAGEIRPIEPGHGRRTSDRQVGSDDA